MSGRSQADLLRWGAELLRKWGLRRAYGFHLIEWAHDEWCPLHPRHLGRHVWSLCECQADGTLVLHVGTTYERRIEVVRNGIPLPVRTREKADR